MTVTLVVPEGYTWFFVNVDDENINEIDAVLEPEFMYYKDGAEYSKAYKRGEWDGYVRLYKRDKHGGPMGLMDRAESLLEEKGYDVVTEIRGERGGDLVELGWHFPHELRPYQKDAVTAVVKNRGGVVGAATGGGKTVIGMRLLYQLGVAGGRGIIFVHTKELLYQWADEIEETLAVEPGLIGDGQWTEGPVTVAIMQTLLSRGADNLEKNYGIAIFDECHRTSAADKMQEIGMEVDVTYRIGLSATPWRRVKGEEMKIEGTIGSQVADIGAPTLIRQGYLAEPTFEVLEHSGPTANRAEKYHDAYRRCIERSRDRNTVIALRAVQLARKGHKVLINVNRIDQGQSITRMVNETSEEAVFLRGSDDTEHRQNVLDNFENGELDVLVSTLIKEGNDIPTISALINAHAGKSDIATIQVIGRALRPAGRDEALIVDVKDDGNYFEDAFEHRQSTMAQYYGEYYDLPYGDAGADSQQTEPPERRSLSEPMSDEEAEELLRDMGVVE